jgi:hypothetical protein
VRPAGKFRRSRFVNVLLLPPDWERLKRIVTERGEQKSPYVRRLILRDLDRSDRKKPELARKKDRDRRSA